MSSTLNSAAQALIAAGNEAVQDETNEVINSAAVAVGKILSLVNENKLPLGTLNQLISWAEDPSQSLSTAQPQQPAALGTSGSPQPTPAPGAASP